MKLKGNVDCQMIMILLIPVILIISISISILKNDETKLKQLELKQKFQLDSMKIYDSLKTRSKYECN